MTGVQTCALPIYGASSILRPTNQGPGLVKQDYHTTLAIDQCDNVTLANLVVESKGENYGNTDAYSGLSGGDPRTNAIINYGGSALLVSRSNAVTLNNVSARYCGSVGVVYLTSSQNIVVEECFANALSLGYAGFAIDNWADATVQRQRTYKFFNCRVAKETATYSAKAGIAAENYPFCTIEPNVGVVEVPDPRLAQLSEIVKPERVVPAIVEFVDIAGQIGRAHV